MRPTYSIIVNGILRTTRRVKYQAEIYAQSIKECHPEWQVLIKFRDKTWQI